MTKYTTRLTTRPALEADDTATAATTRYGPGPAGRISL